jgi:hypothetical protein
MFAHVNSILKGGFMLRLLSLVSVCLIINACGSKPTASDEKQVKRMERMMLIGGPHGPRI